MLLLAALMSLPGYGTYVSEMQRKHTERLAALRKEMRSRPFGQTAYHPPRSSQGRTSDFACGACAAVALQFEIGTSASALLTSHARSSCAQADVVGIPSLQAPAPSTARRRARTHSSSSAC